MPIKIVCPSCARQLRVPDELLGKSVRCPSCQTTFSAAAPEEETGVTSAPTSDKVSRSQPVEPPIEDYEEVPEEEDEDHEARPRKRRRSRDGADRPRRRPHHGGLVMALGIVSLVAALLGAVGVLCCGALGLLVFGLAGTATGLPAWLLGQSDLKAMRNGAMDLSGDGITKGGWICGIIGTVLGVLELLCGGVLLIFVVGMVATGKLK
jgi:predicted Zn finger-like uncharacterized protein